MYHFKFADKYLQVTPSLDGRKILSSLVKNTEPTMTPNSIFRTGEFDNQGSSRPWTWAWTTDKNPFEIWRPGGLYLKLDPIGQITLFKYKIYSLKAPVALSIGKTGPFSYGVIGLNSDGLKTSLIKDTYPFFDSLFNTTYDGLCEDEDFFPLLKMGRELASKLKIPFDETIFL